MSVIIRLQNLPWSANALDIRQYFHGLSIPEGGVHIVGGELGDAFIAFSTDEDARQAFNLNNGKIKEVQIKLMLSSRTEMQKVIEAARNQSLAAFMQTPPPQMPSIVPPVIPSAVPELKKEENNKDRDSKDKRDKRRSRSRSRDRKERSRERDRDRRDRRYNRDRSRSRSRDRKDRRRRDRSRSRDRDTRSRERDRKNTRHSGSREGSQLKDQKPRIGVWENPTPIEQLNIVPPVQTAAAITLLEEARRNLNNLIPQTIDNANVLALQRNAFNRPQEQPWPIVDRPPVQNLVNEIANRPNTFDNPDDRFEQQAPRRSLLSNYNPRFQGAVGFNNRDRDPQNRPEGNRFNRPEQHENPPPLRNCCIQLQPFYGGYGELKKFFQGLYISNTGIKFVNDDFGKRTDIVYIRFTHPESKEQALLKHGSVLKNSVVEIAHLDDEEFEAIPGRYRAELLYNQQQEFNNPDLYRDKNQKFYNNRQNQQPSKPSSSIVIEDLPTFVKDQDIFKMFPDYPIDSVYVSTEPRNSNIAYVKFRNPEDANKVLGDKSKHVFEGKPILIRPARDDERDMKASSQNEIDTHNDQEEPMMVDTDCLYLSGLPVKVTDRDICDFFSDVGVVPIKVHLVDGHGGFKGESYCEFASEREASVALEKDGTILASNLITVKPVPRDEMIDALISSNQLPDNGPLLHPPRYFPRNNYGPRGHFRPPMGRRFPPPMAGMNDAPPGCTVMMENVPYKAGLDEILDFFSGFDIPNENVLRRFNDNGTPSGEAKVIFNSADEAYQAVNDKRGRKIRDRPIYLTQC